MNPPKSSPPGPVDLTKLTDDELQWLLVAVPREIETRRSKHEAQILAFIREQIAVKAISTPRLRAALFGKSARKRDGDGDGKDRRSVVKAKYRDQKTGSTWAGRGAPPKWFSDHIAAGGKKEDLLIREPDDDEDKN